ncbi:MAG: hypothetical protein WDN44_15995 [Sphingomonas sp.]
MSLDQGGAGVKQFEKELTSGDLQSGDRADQRASQPAWRVLSFEEYLVIAQDGQQRGQPRIGRRMGDARDSVGIVDERFQSFP